MSTDKNKIESTQPTKERIPIIEERVLQIKGVAKMEDAEIALFLGVEPGKWSQYKTGYLKKPAAKYVAKIAEITGFSIDWIATGVGNPDAGSAAPCRENVAKYGGNLEELMGKAWAVLTSETIYASALTANIDAFHSAVVGENAKRELDERVEKLEKIILENAKGCSSKHAQEAGG